VSRFTVDARGQLVPETAEAQRGLASSQGRFTRQETSPDLLLLVRTPAKGGAAPSPRVVLAGDASGFPIADLIAFLSQARWTGLVRVNAPNGERTLSLQEGEVRAATSDDPTDRLGEVIIRLGYSSREAIERLLMEHPPSRIGRVLVEGGALQAHDLWKCISQQVSEIFHAIVLAREGAFVLVDQPLDEKQSSTVRLSTQSLLMDSIRKIDELAHFRKRIPHGRLYPVKQRGSDGRLEPEEEAALAQVDGQKSLLDLAMAVKVSEFDITKIAFRLLEGGYVTLSERPVAAGEKAEPVRGKKGKGAAKAPEAAAKVVRIFNQIFHEIAGELTRQGGTRDFLAAANAALSEQAQSDSPVLEGLSFQAVGTLEEDALLERISGQGSGLGPDPIAALRRTLSDVMFFLLFQAGDMLDPRADEDLNRRVKDLLGGLETP
jgi:hypothetical protein